MKPQSGETRSTAGSFEDAERQRARAMARLTPAQRIRIVCDMHALNRQIVVARGKERTAEARESDRR